MRFLATIFLLSVLALPVLAQSKPAPVYVTLWFDTEDYILPQSDDAALRLAEMLTRLGIKATFKVVGEKARVLEQRKRTDVIAALKKHEIGFFCRENKVQAKPWRYASRKKLNYIFELNHHHLSKATIHKYLYPIYPQDKFFPQNHLKRA